MSTSETLSTAPRSEAHHHRANLLRVSDIKLCLTELSVLFDLTIPTVKKRLENIEPIPGPMQSFLYPLKKSMQAVYVHGSDSINELKLHRERQETRLASARAKKCELDNEERERKLIKIEDAEDVYLDFVTKFRSRLLSIPNRAGHSLVNISSAAKVQETLTSLIHEALDELSSQSLSEAIESNQKA